MPHCLIHIFTRQNEIKGVTTENNDRKIVHWLWRLPRDVEIRMRRDLSALSLGATKAREDGQREQSARHVRPEGIRAYVIR